MTRLIAVLGFIFGTLLAIVITNGNSLVSGPEMDISGNKFEKIDLDKLGKGKEARFCPVSGDEIMPGQRVEAALPNGKRIVLCCLDCQEAVEKDEKKYEAFLF